MYAGTGIMHSQPMLSHLSLIQVSLVRQTKVSDVLAEFNVVTLCKCLGQLLSDRSFTHIIVDRSLHSCVIVYFDNPLVPFWTVFPGYLIISLHSPSFKTTPMENAKKNKCIHEKKFTMCAFKRKDKKFSGIELFLLVLLLSRLLSENICCRKWGRNSV